MKILLRVVIVLALLIGAAYLAFGYVIYDQLSLIALTGEGQSNTPSSFRVDYEDLTDFDTTPYLIPSYEEVSFPSRQPGVILSGWYAEVKPAAPVVILTHGLGAGKQAANVLLVAGMLYKNSFNVLLFDMRNHGQSTSDGGRTSIGNKEYKDVLGAWDYLVTEREYNPDSVGLFGLSLGAGTALNAFAEEPRLAAILVDSPFADLQQIIAEELARTGYPPVLAQGGILTAHLFAEVNLLEHSPKDAIRNHAGRPIFIIHGMQDDRIRVHHTVQLMDLAKETGANVDVWYVNDAGHCLAEFLHHDDYEQRLVTFFRASLLPTNLAN